LEVWRQVVEHLPSKFKAPSLTSALPKKEKVNIFTEK
jgi:hypothetical protein